MISKSVITEWISKDNAILTQILILVQILQLWCYVCHTTTYIIMQECFNNFYAVRSSSEDDSDGEYDTLLSVLKTEVIGMFCTIINLTVRLFLSLSKYEFLLEFYFNNNEFTTILVTSYVNFWIYSIICLQLYRKGWRMVNYFLK